MDAPAASTLIIGLDGATWDLIRPFQAAGHLPHLARLMAEGAYGPLRSTLPPMTFPAWSSFMTGKGPGRHGLFDFTVHETGRYGVRFTNASYREGPTIWRLYTEAGGRVGVMGFPGTYPPEPLRGAMISGFDAPVTTGIDSSFVHPPELYRELRRKIGPYAITEFQELNIGPGWHERALGGLLSALERKLEYARYLLERKGPWDCFALVLGESDTVAHHFWLFHDPASPRHDPEGARRFGGAILRVYQALDEAVGELVALAGGDRTRVLVLSDHGFGGAGIKNIHLNRWLTAEGLLVQREGSGRGITFFKRLKDLGMRHVPPRLQEQLFRRFGGRLASRVESSSRYGGIEWAETQAYSDELNYFPSIWVNLAGREPEGTVQPGAEYDRLLEWIAFRLEQKLLDPETGQAVVKKAWRRDALYRGPYLERAPDLVLELALDQGYSYGVLPGPAAEGPAITTIGPGEMLGAKGRGMNGTHRRHGIVILRGRGVARVGEVAGAAIEDLAPTLLHLVGLPVPGGMDGRVLEAFLDPRLLAAHPAKRHPAVESAEERATEPERLAEPRDKAAAPVREEKSPGSSGEPPGSAKEPPGRSKEPPDSRAVPYSAEEEERLRKRLKRLGYLSDD